MKLITLALLFSTALLAADVTGKWSGSFTKSDAYADGRTEPVLLILKQDGKTLTGSGGPNESEQLPISSGKIEGDRVTFELSTGKGPLSFQLVLKGDQLKGDMKREFQDGRTETAKLDVKRVSE